MRFLPWLTVPYCVGLWLVSAGSGAETATDVPSWGEQWQRAEWVAQVRVESVSTLLNPSLTGEGLSGVEAYRYRIAEQRRWKGDSAEQLRVDVQDCRQRLEVGAAYVIFARRGPRSELRSFSCDDAVAVDDGESLLQWLDQPDGERSAATDP